MVFSLEEQIRSWYTLLQHYTIPAPLQKDFHNGGDKNLDCQRMVDDTQIGTRNE